MEILLEQSQVQKQTLSPQMIQSMEILQMSALELEQYVGNLLLENPVLEREETPLREEGSALLQALEWRSSHSRRERRVSPGEGRDPADAMVSPWEESLYEHLHQQIIWSRLSLSLRRGVEGVLSGLNDSGYLEEGPAELALRCAVEEDVIHQAEELVRKLEPAGVGARTLSQCLELQLLRRGEDGLVLTIVQKHLEDVARHHYHRIAQATQATREEIQAACVRLRSLDPRPGMAFAPAENPGYLAPDVLVVQGDDGLEVLLCGEDSRELKLSEYYLQLLESSEDPQVQHYLKEKVTQAQWVMQQIDQRSTTLLRCTKALVGRQAPFFRGVSAGPLPMTLADLAGEVQVHPSTVSRALRDKYLQCDRGLFPIKSFFARGIGDTPEDTSVGEAKAALSTLIDGEDKKHPLSDEKLCQGLREQGYSLARRTVAKYREELGYPPAPGRRVI